MPIESKTSNGMSKKTIGLVIGAIILVLAVLGVLAYNQRMADQRAEATQSDNGNNMPVENKQIPAPEPTLPATVNQSSEQATPTIETPATPATTTDPKTTTKPVEKPKTQTSTPTPAQINDSKTTPESNNNSNNNTTNPNTNPPVPPTQDLGAFDF
jgi:hypothetical protein